MAGKYLRGALIEFGEYFPSPIPNIIIFQFNPESMTHTWAPATTNPGTPGSASNPLAITGDPQESFSFTLAMDATDMIADGDAVETALATGPASTRGSPRSKCCCFRPRRRAAG